MFAHIQVTAENALLWAQYHAQSAYAHPLFWFAALFVFRYLRLVVHIISFWCYRPAPIPKRPRWTSRDATVILPTVDPDNRDFQECIATCLDNDPYEIMIVTVGREKERRCEVIVAPYRRVFPGTRITILLADEANKRRQVATAIPHVRTEITVLLDDHVFWPSTFLKQALAPFEDKRVGGVGTNKRVRRTDVGFNIRSFWNMLGAIYLERHNFEIRATNAIDGGVFVISGRTSLHRTKILQSNQFLDGFTNERFFFGLFGPLNADDDNYITRFEVSQGWDIKIQYSPESCIETTLGTYPKFMSQCLRWVRTTWRSNSASLFTDRTVWYRQPWCVYAVYITSFFNFALFNDAGLAYLLYRSGYGDETTYTALGIWIFATKMVKLIPYFLRHPEDLRMLPGYFIFAYFHSFIKLYALFTFWNCHWGGRNLAAINVPKIVTTPVKAVFDRISPDRDSFPRNSPVVPEVDHNGRTHCEHCGGSYRSVWKGLWTEFWELFYYTHDEKGTIQYTVFGGIVCTALLLWVLMNLPYIFALYYKI